MNHNNSIYLGNQISTPIKNQNQSNQDDSGL